MAANERLIAPVKIKIASIDKSLTFFDEDAGEPISGAVRRSKFEINAQIHFTNEDRPNPEPGGVREETKGYVVILSKDLTALGKSINRGDLIEEIGGDEVELFIMERKTDYHWDSTKFIRFTFADRHPVNQEGDT